MINKVTIHVHSTLCDSKLNAENRHVFGESAAQRTNGALRVRESRPALAGTSKEAGRKFLKFDRTVVQSDEFV